MSTGDETLINVTQLIDDGPVRPIQVAAIALCALVAFLDGADTQLIGIAAPIIAQELDIARAAIGPVFSAGLLGAAIGALAFGPLGDRFGRKRMLVIATVMFGVFTLATAYARSFESLLAIRFLAGIGLGGATPCFITLACEFAPKQRRGMVASLIWAAFPLGVMIGGFASGAILGALGWQAVFIIGGLLPIAVALVLLVWLPESLRFLLARGDRNEAIARTVRRLRTDVPASARFISDETAVEGAPVRHLFTEGRAVATVLLWVPFFMAFGTLALAVLWTPLLLRDNGIEPAQAGIVIGVHGIGSLIGVSCAGRLVERFGMLVLVPALLIGAVTTGWIGYAATSVPTMAAAQFLIGLFVGAGASGAIALAALLYPTSIRSSGIGWAMAVGRTGQVVAPLFAGAAVAVGWSGVQLFIALAAAPVAAALAVFALRLVTVKADETIGTKRVRQAA